MALSDKQVEALRMVRDGRVRYVPIPVPRKKKPYFLVDRMTSPDTRTFNSLKRRGLIMAPPTIRSVEVALTTKGERLI